MLSDLKAAQHKDIGTKIKIIHSKVKLLLHYVLKSNLGLYFIFLLYNYNWYKDVYTVELVYSELLYNEAIVSIMNWFQTHNFFCSNFIGIYIFSYIQWSNFTGVIFDSHAFLTPNNEFFKQFSVTHTNNSVYRERCHI